MVGSIHIGEIEGKDYSIEIADLITSRTAILGMSGSGKSNLIAVICEELCKQDLSFVILDPEGEYSSLKEKHEVVWAGFGSGADYGLSMRTCEKLAMGPSFHGGRFIIDTSGAQSETEELDVVEEFLSKLYSFNTTSKRSTLLIVEEADRYVPQAGGRRVGKLYDIARRGRKRGIGMIVASQRPQAVDKNILSQCNNQMIGKLRLPNDLDAVETFFSFKSDLKSLPSFKAGEFFVMGELSPSSARIQAKYRETYSLGATPKIHRTENFTVEDFMSGAREVENRGSDDFMDEEDIIDSYNETVGEAKPGSKAGRRFTKTVTGIPYKLPEAMALEKVRSEFKLDLLGRPRETIDNIQMGYWPFIVCRFMQVDRNILGKVRKKEFITVWDFLRYRVAKFKQNNDVRFSRSFDSTLTRFLNRKAKKSSEDWKCIRLLIEIQKQDLSSHDMVSRLPDIFTTRTVKGHITKLKKAGCIVNSGSAGKAALYRPAMKIPSNLGIRDFETIEPATEAISLNPDNPVIKPIALAHGIESIVKAYVDNVEMLNSSMFHLPVYVVTLANKKKGKRRALVINGCTGNVMDIDELEKIFEKV